MRAVQSFEGREVRDRAESVAEDYEAPTFQTQALQHTRVKSTWDADDASRKRALGKRVTKDELRDDDFKVDRLCCCSTPLCITLCNALCVQATLTCPPLLQQHPILHPPSQRRMRAGHAHHTVAYSLPACALATTTLTLLCLLVKSNLMESCIESCKNPARERISLRTGLPGLGQRRQRA